MLYQLTYRSKAVPEITAEEIKSILFTSNEKNSENNITGCLLYNEGFFVQILEGAKQNVKEIFEVIEADKRHTMVEVLSEGETTERFFEKWWMAYLKLPEEPQTPKETEVKSSLKQLEEKAFRPNFTTKVFWYNVNALLQETGFYRT